MSATRVDKEWQRKGLGAYDTSAILGTLGHYGVNIDEAGFRGLSEKLYPLGIAEAWSADWKGKGQFSRFPFAAATELWRRWSITRPLPADFADAVAELVNSLSKRLMGTPPEVLNAQFEKVEKIRASVPKKEEGGIDETFGAELFQLLDARGEAFVQAFDELAEMLAKTGHVPEAERFAELEEFLLPDRTGVVRAVVRAAKGEKDEAIKDLEGLLTQTPRRSEGAVLIAVDALMHVKANEAALSHATRLLDEAEKAEDYHLALQLCERLALLYEWTEDLAAMRELEKRAQTLADAHEKAHPHHAHAHAH